MMRVEKQSDKKEVVRAGNTTSLNAGAAFERWQKRQGDQWLNEVVHADESFLEKVLTGGV